jgi:hypothetical protein
VDIGLVDGVVPLVFDPLIPTVFHEPWWLAAATGGNFDEVTVRSGGRVVGRFPFVLSHMMAGHALCGMPELVHFLGPAIDAGTGSAANRALKHDGILRELIACMPKASGWYQKLHRETTDTLVFQEHGFATSVQFSYEIAPGPEQAIWSAMRDKTRNVIRRAGAAYTVAELPDPEQFSELYAAHLRIRGGANHYQRIGAVCDAALTHGRGKIVAALNENGVPEAAIFYAWDARTTYYLLTTRSESAGNGAVALLIWHAIRESTARGRVFDFDGVATAGSRLFYTGFGGRVVPRYIITRYTMGHRIAGRLANPWRGKTQQRFQF